MSDKTLCASMWFILSQQTQYTAHTNIGKKRLELMVQTFNSQAITTVLQN